MLSFLPHFFLSSTYYFPFCFWILKSHLQCIDDVVVVVVIGVAAFDESPHQSLNLKIVTIYDLCVLVQFFRFSFRWTIFPIDRPFFPLFRINTNAFKNSQFKTKCVAAAQLPTQIRYLVSMCLPYEHRHRTKSAQYCNIRKCIALPDGVTASAQCG